MNPLFENQALKILCIFKAQRIVMEKELKWRMNQRSA